MSVLERNISTPVYSVSAFNHQIKDLLETHYNIIWIEGEISNFSQPRSGHWYFSLKDAHAQIRCVMFRYANQRLLLDVTDGLAVTVCAKASLYCERGDFQLIVEHLEIAGQGDLQAAYEALKQKLQALGLFEPARKKPLPSWPKTIGVITSSTGAVIRDILTTLSRRYPLAQVILYPTLVQGKQAAPAIIEALILAHQHAKAEVLIVARGGGSLEDLWAFNEESVIMAIANSTLPIISAIGHETDFTLTDFVADLRAPTPTAAAELVSPNLHDWAVFVTQKQQQLVERMRDYLQNIAQRLDDLTYRLQSHHPLRRTQEQQRQVAHWQSRLILAMTRRLEKYQHQIRRAHDQLQAMSPLKTLARGYSIVRKTDGTWVRSIQQITSGDTIRIWVQDGEFDAVVVSPPK